MRSTVSWRPDRARDVHCRPTNTLGSNSRLAGLSSLFSVSSSAPHHREFPAINRLISANDGVQSECGILFQSGFLWEVKAPFLGFRSWLRSTRRAGPLGSRYSLSHFRRRRGIWKPIGSRLMEDQSCADVPFACATRSPCRISGGPPALTTSSQSSYVGLVRPGNAVCVDTGIERRDIRL